MESRVHSFNPSKKREVQMQSESMHIIKYEVNVHVRDKGFREKPQGFASLDENFVNI